jgi:hypothetical protein
MRIVSGRLAVLAAAVAAVAAVVVPTGTASASAADCAGGANGFVDISDWGADDYRPVGPELLWSDGTRVNLFFGTFGGRTRGYAELWNGTWDVPVTGTVWMDWSRDGGRTWLQCGPFGNPANKASITSAAQLTNSSTSWVFRAGGYHNGQQILTGWY